MNQRAPRRIGAGRGREEQRELMARPPIRSPLSPLFNATAFVDERVRLANYLVALVRVLDREEDLVHRVKASALFVVGLDGPESRGS